MVRFCYALLVVGLMCYVTAVFLIGTDTGETLSDIGNAVLLVTAVILLLRLSGQSGQRGSGD
ncbi:MAG: hypothetical protein JSU87_03775 [Gemmatimonadota bacterium]|nr:MAG: hypothetical protein JSU87_03775 [Gemmatimonadota bacterium]